MTYERLEREAAKPRRIVDHRVAFERLTPIEHVNGVAGDRIAHFCEQKRISIRSLAALGARAMVERNGGGVALVFGFPAELGGREIIPAVKFRPLDDSKKRYTATPSVFLQPLVVGRRDSMDVFIGEGETDGARLAGLVGDDGVVIVIPAGALTFRPEWAARIPRGATVHLCHDADEAGDKGAAKAARILGGRTVRVRPPIEGGDWCDWPGDRDEFIAIVAAARKGDDRPFALPLDEFIAEKTDTPPALVGDEAEILLPAAGLLILFARGGKGKTTKTVDACYHYVSGIDYDGYPVSRPLRILFVENEGPREPFRRKLELKRKVWPHEIKGAIHVCTFNWGAITLKDSTHVQLLRDYIVAHEIDLVVGDPLDSLGLDGVGSPEDTREFMRLLGETGLFRDVAWWLLAHARKEGAQDELDEISGAWGGRPDTMLMLSKQAGNRARLSFPKIRWSRRASRPALILEFDPDTESFSVVGEEAAEERDYLAEVDAFLDEHVWKTAKEIATGISANVDRVRNLLEANADLFVSRTGSEAKEVGRHPSATVYAKVTRGSESPESPRDFRGGDE
jgi:hypothetical protein